MCLFPSVIVSSEEHAVQLCPIFRFHPMMIGLELILQYEPKLLDVAEQQFVEETARSPLGISTATAPEASGDRDGSGCHKSDIHPRSGQLRQFP